MKAAILSITLGLALVGAAHSQEKSGDMKAGDVKSADAAMMVDTATFAKQVASSNEFEIQSSRIALEKLPDGPMEAFAQQMIADHTKAGEEFKAALEKAGKPVPPPQLAPKHAAMIDLLKGAEGGDVAALYTDMQFLAHKEAVMLFMTFAKGGDDPVVQDFAATTLPTLDMHLMHVKGMVEKGKLH